MQCNMFADIFNRTHIPREKKAAVLVLLYEKDGNLRVLLTTRSKTLRAHPGQTALPGGKVDDTDKDVIETAVRYILLAAQNSHAMFDSIEKRTRRSGSPWALHLHTHFVSSDSLFRHRGY